MEHQTHVGQKWAIGCIVEIFYNTFLVESDKSKEIY